MQIRVASLNFSGINISPFEYHDGSQEKIHLNSLFKEILQSHDQKNLKKYEENNIAKIDLIFQKNRYTPLYNSSVGVLRGKLITLEQFDAIWDLIFQQNSQNLKTSNLPEIEVNLLKDFDKTLYQALLNYIYGQIDWSQIRQYDASIYQNELTKWHSKSYLNIESKAKAINNYLLIRNLDILFLQEANAEKISKYLPQSYLSFTCASNSMIILKKNFLAEDENNQYFLQKFGKILNFNNDSTFVKLKDFLLVSVHLSSKKIKTEQFENMKQIFRKIQSQYPKLKIIVGIDANQYISKMDNFAIFPSTHSEFTNRKKRTHMQLQFQKAQLIVEDVKDHIITNLKLTESNVQNIMCQSANLQFLPNEDHPFDHFAVFSKIIHQNFSNVDEVLEEVHEKIDMKGSSICNSTEISQDNRYEESCFTGIVVNNCANVKSIFNSQRNSEDLQVGADLIEPSNKILNQKEKQQKLQYFQEQPFMSVFKFTQQHFRDGFDLNQKHKWMIQPFKFRFRARGSSRSKSSQKIKYRRVQFHHANLMLSPVIYHKKEESKELSKSLFSPKQKNKCHKKNKF